MERPSKEQIREMPIFEGVPLDKIIVIKDKWAALKAVEELNKHSVVGFDTESKPTFRKGEVSNGPHLIQLSCINKTYLFPARFKDAIEELGAILNNDKIKKVGFGLSEDEGILYKKFGIKVVNTEELSIKVKKFTGVKQRVGARVAVAMMFKERLTKSSQRSNWAKFPLEEHQLRYAANDAYSALCIELEIESRNCPITSKSR